MGADLYERFDAARERFDAADKKLGRAVAKLCFQGPDEELRQTRNTQPALFCVEAILCDLLAERGIEPSYTAGHSLGEYAALYAAGVLSFEDGLDIVARRGELMARAGERRPGTMAAVIGLDRAQIEQVLRAVTEGVVVAANHNSPVQTVISGEVAAVGKACERLKEAGAKRAVPLAVSGAFHSPLMRDAAEEFAEFLRGFEFRAPRCPVVANVTARPETDPAVMKDLLIKQLVSPVRWVDSIAALVGLGQSRFVEVGPGSVLKGLVEKCASGANVVPCSSAENVFSLASST
jgi:[acyl-carrier-protein] S-malonyltransferase